MAATANKQNASRNNIRLRNSHLHFGSDWFSNYLFFVAGKGSDKSEPRTRIPARMRPSQRTRLVPHLLEQDGPVVTKQVETGSGGEIHSVTPEGLPSRPVLFRPVGIRQALG